MFQSNRMNPERRPLLLDAEMQGRSARTRSDATIVDADDGMFSWLHLNMWLFC